MRERRARREIEEGVVGDNQRKRVKNEREKERQERKRVKSSKVKIAALIS